MHILWLVLIGFVAGLIAKLFILAQMNHQDLFSLRYWA
jgi:uncharacterized membrane protein YeaQ/YmgE (transglycosylase-associated protein family)